MGLSIRPDVHGTSLNAIHSHSSAFKNVMTSKSTANVVKNINDFHQNRFRRDHNYAVGPETYINDNGNNSKVVKMVCD